MKSYYEKLKDPRWQKKRLEILERDEYTCQNCGNTEKTLCVHHWLYDKNPWDVDSEYLITVCDECHSTINEIIKKINLVLNNFLSSSGTISGDSSIKNQIINHLEEFHSNIWTLTNALMCSPFGDKESALNMVQLLTYNMFELGVMWETNKRNG